MLALAPAAVLALAALSLADHLADARARLPALQAAAVRGDTGRAAAEHAAVRAHTAAAARIADSPLWRAASQLPYAGRTLRAAGGTAQQVDVLVGQALPPVLDLRRNLSPERLVQSGGRIDLTALRPAGSQVRRVSGLLREVGTSLDGLPHDGVLPAVREALTELIADVDELNGFFDTAATALDLLPGALGADQPRRYFVGFQTNAESRGTGGLLGAYAVLESDRGQIRFTHFGSNDELDERLRPTLDLGAEARALYGPDIRLWKNSNLSPAFPQAARLWLDLWQQQTGERLDGAVATDPLALARLLRATGPVRLPDGQLLDEKSAADTVFREAYVAYSEQDGRRERYLVDMARSVAARLLAPDTTDTRALVRALRDVAEDGRLLMWSAHPQEQEQLVRTPVAGVLPATPGPFVALVLNNGGANKLDYYLDRAVHYRLEPCQGAARSATVRVRLRNRAPTGGLPAYVTGAPGQGRAPGANRLLVHLHLSVGAVVRRTTLDGQPVTPLAGQERGRPVLALSVDLDPGRLREVVVQLREPARGGDAVLPVQPLVRPQVTTVSAAPCTESGPMYSTGPVALSGAGS